MSALLLFITWYVFTGFACSRVVRGYRLKTMVEFKVLDTVLMILIWPIAFMPLLFLMDAVSDALEELSNEK